MRGPGGARRGGARAGADGLRGSGGRRFPSGRRGWAGLSRGDLATEQGDRGVYVGGGRARLNRGCAQLDQRIAAAQQPAGQIGVERSPPLAQLAEDILHLVGQASHRLEAEHARRALDGVGGPEDTVDRDSALLLVVCALNRQQAVVDHPHVLGGLLAELVVEGGEIHS